MWNCPEIHMLMFTDRHYQLFCSCVCSSRLRSLGDSHNDSHQERSYRCDCTHLDSALHTHLCQHRWSRPQRVCIQVHSHNSTQQMSNIWAPFRIKITMKDQVHSKWEFMNSHRSLWCGNAGLRTALIIHIWTFNLAASSFVRAIGTVWKTIAYQARVQTLSITALEQVWKASFHFTWFSFLRQSLKYSAAMWLGKK